MSRAFGVVGLMRILDCMCNHLSYSLNSLKGAYVGDHIGDYYRAY